MSQECPTCKAKEEARLESMRKAAEEAKAEMSKDRQPFLRGETIAEWIRVCGVDGFEAMLAASLDDHFMWKFGLRVYRSKR